MAKTKTKWVATKGLMGWQTRNVRFDHPDFPEYPVMHCCHPTANYPWFIMAAGERLITFRTLKQAQWFVEHGGGSVVNEDTGKQLWAEMLRST